MVYLVGCFVLICCWNLLSRANPESKSTNQQPTNLLQVYNRFLISFIPVHSVSFVGLSPAKSVLAHWIGWINLQQQINWIETGIETCRISCWLIADWLISLICWFHWRIDWISLIYRQSNKFQFNSTINQIKQSIQQSSN